MTEPAKKTAKKAAKKATKKATKKPEAPAQVERPDEKPLEFDPQATEAGFPDGFAGYPAVVEGVREITQNPNFDPTIDDEEDFE